MGALGLDAAFREAALQVTSWTGKRFRSKFHLALVTDLRKSALTANQTLLNYFSLVQMYFLCTVVYCDHKKVICATSTKVKVCNNANIRSDTVNRFEEGSNWEASLLYTI